MEKVNDQQISHNNLTKKILKVIFVNIVQIPLVVFVWKTIANQYTHHIVWRVNCNRS